MTQKHFEYFPQCYSLYLESMSDEWIFTYEKKCEGNYRTVNRPTINAVVRISLISFISYYFFE